MNCIQCFWKRNNQDGGHCYMFRESTMKAFCAQYHHVPTQIKPNNQQVVVSNRDVHPDNRS